MSIYGIRSGGYPATAGYPYGRTERGTGTGVYAKYAETLQGSDRADGNFVLHYFDHEDGERAVARKKLTASYNGVPLRRSADDKKYTDKESNSKNDAANIVPPRINGILFPIFVSVLSDSKPNSGKRKIASTLSIAINAPVTVSPKWKVFWSISGIILSYICQNPEIDKNAKPIKNVRL